MHSETPQEDRRADADHGDRTSPQNRPDTPGSLGREISEHINTNQRDAIPALSDHPIDAGPMLMPHERKLSADEQRNLLAMRRHNNDGVDDTLAELERLREAERVLRYESWRLEHAAELAQRHAREMHDNSATSQNQAMLNATFGRYEGVFAAMNAGMNALDAQRLPLNAEERSNVAGALTAQLAQTPGFNRDGFDPKQLSVAVGEGNDRVFAIHGSHPGAPDAVYANVSVDQAKQQSLQVSGAAATAEPPQPQRAAPQQETEQPSQANPAIAPRTLI
jgi:hypothetical protein